MGNHLIFSLFQSWRIIIIESRIISNWKLDISSLFSQNKKDISILISSMQNGTEQQLPTLQEWPFFLSDLTIMVMETVRFNPTVPISLWRYQRVQFA
jgi:hypothetical protein